MLVRDRPLGCVLRVLCAAKEKEKGREREGKGSSACAYSHQSTRQHGRTDLAVEVEYAPAVVDGDGGRGDEPGGDLAVPGVEDGEVAAEEEDELEEVEADEGVPEPRVERLARLWNGFSD